MKEDVPGLELSRRFYLEAVAPVLDAEFSDLSYSAALIGPGSDVLGFDTPMSRDHDWGPRLLVFIHDEHDSSFHHVIVEHLAHSLPTSFMGYSTHFSLPDPDDGGTQVLEPHEYGPVRHGVRVHDLNGYVSQVLGAHPGELSLLDWLRIPTQRLRSITSGGVFRDDLGLEGIRSKLSRYPRDVWLVRASAIWRQLGELEPLMARAGMVGDDLGARILAAELARRAMDLAFLHEHTWAPYPKWFGSAFSRLESARTMTPVIEKLLCAQTTEARQDSWVELAELLIVRLNKTSPCATIDSSPRPFFGRGFMVIGGHRVSDAMIECIDDDALRTYARRTSAGAIDDLTTLTAVREGALSDLADLWRRHE